MYTAMGKSERVQLVCPPKKVPLPTRISGPHVEHGSLGPTWHTSQLAAPSAQLFLQGSPMCQTHRHTNTDHGTSVTIVRI